MNQDEVIPPSPPVKLKKVNGQSRRSNSMRRSKLNRPILSLRSKLHEKPKETEANGLSGVSIVQEISPIEKSFDIYAYASVDDEPTEEKEHIGTQLNEFDILAQAKLIEQCNQFDLSQKGQPTQKNCEAHQFSATQNLCSLAILLATQNHLENSPDTDDTSPLNAVAKEISQENLQFSEWPTDLNNTIRANGQAQTDCDGRENSSASSIVHSILLDFCNDDDDDDSAPNQEENAQTPSFILIRRAQRKTYERPSTAQFKTLIFDDSDIGECGGHGNKDRDDSIENQIDKNKSVRHTDNEQCDSTDDDDANDGTQNNDIDIDLNASRLIVENLTKLSTFFTQSQSHELDFNVDLSHTIHDFEKRFDNFECVLDDDFHNDRIHISYSNDKSDIEAEAAATTSATTEAEATYGELSSSFFNEHDDFLMTNIETPKGIQCSKKDKRNMNDILTPSSSKESHVRDFSKHSTPSTSRTTALNDHRVAKRLRFAAETNHMEINNVFSSARVQNAPEEMIGFATARGNAIQLTEKAMKRAAGKFIDIDSVYGHIDPSIDEPPLKRNRIDKNVTFEQNESNNITPERPNHMKFDGFRLASGRNEKLAKTATTKARNIFGEDLSDLGFDDSIIGFKPCTIAEPINLPGMGFKTAAGSSIAATATNVQRYSKVLDDIGEQSFAGPSKPIEMGFKTAAGSNIAVKVTNMQRYTKVLDDIDQEIGSCTQETDSIVITDLNVNQSALECKTPIAKFNRNRRPDAFTTSTPIPNVTPGFKNTNLPPITPIIKRNLVEQNLEDFNSWIAQDKIDVDQVFTCTPFTDVSHQNQSVNDSNASAFQHSIDANLTETGIDVIHISDAVKSARKNALSQQQTGCFKKPYSISPVVGWLFIKKLVHSMQLHELGTPKMYTRDELERFGIPLDVIDVDINNALQFKFDMWNFYPLDVCRTNVDGIDMYDNMKLIMNENSRVGVRELTSAFLQCPTVDPKLIPDHWINNSLKWIILKLSSYERNFPEKFAGRSLTPENVLAQLKYRYDREIDKVERSAIRRIVERDDTPAKRMILFVSRISEQSLVYSLELSDGWYSIRTHSLDPVLSNAISKRKIVIGTKLVIQGAELIGIEEGCSPLEMPKSVALKISANSTRRAKWYAKLGYCKESWPFAVSLNSVHGSGGIISRMTAYIVRVYPLVFAVKEKTADGQKTIFRSNKVEQRQGKKDDRKQFEIYEKLYSEAAAEIEKEYEAAMKSYKSPRKKLCDIDDAEELWNFMEHSSDGISFEADLTMTQKKLLTDYQTKMYDDKQNKITAIVRKKLDAVESPTKSTALQKVRLIDATAPNAQKTAILSIWNADNTQISLRENTLLDLRYVTANGMRGKDVLLTATAMSVLREERSSASTVHGAFSRQLIPISNIDALQFKPSFNEFDTLGIVVRIDEAMPNHYQSIFVADANQNLLCIKFWGGLEQYAYEDIVKERAIIVMCQLDWRSHSRLNLNGIPQAFVTEITTFSVNPKSTERIYAMNCLREQLDQIDLNAFIEECVQKLSQNNHTNKENSISNSIYNTSSNSPTLNRTAPASTAACRSAPGVLQRIEQLRKYGSPPPLSNSYLKINKHSHKMVNKPFKNPCKEQTPSTSNS